MRIVLFSDVHGNAEALDAVMGAIRRESPAYVMCAGDIVGYGADPGWSLEIVRQVADYVVCGNHDRACAGIHATDRFHRDAAYAIEWTRKVLSLGQLRYLQSLPFVARGHGSILVHGSPARPNAFPYIITREDAAAACAASSEMLCVVGHTHCPGIYSCHEGVAVREREKKVRCLPRVRYLVNAGSVGQPRDGDWRASYAIYDSAARYIEIKRMRYDVTRAQRKILKAGLPVSLARRLGYGV